MLEKTFAADGLTWDGRSLWDQFAELAAHDAAALAVVDAQERPWTRGELLARALELRDALAGRTIGAGDRVMIEARKTAETIAGVLAISSLNAIACPYGDKLSKSDIGALEARLGHRLRLAYNPSGAQAGAADELCFVAPPEGAIPSDDAPQSSWIVNLPLSISYAASDWTFSQVFVKFPKLKFALSEGGIGWVPYFLERADFTYQHHKAWTHQDMGGRLPSQIFRDNIITCFIDDKFGVQNRHQVGINTICWECDYPHSDSTWPKSAEILWESMKDVPKDEVDLMTHLNAMREFSFDPFAVRKRETCTVGALRAQAKAKGVDTTPVPGRGGIKAAEDDTCVVTCGDVLRQFAEAAAT